MIDPAIGTATGTTIETHAAKDEAAIANTHQMTAATAPEVHSENAEADMIATALGHPCAGTRGTEGVEVAETRTEDMIATTATPATPATAIPQRVPEAHLLALAKTSASLEALFSPPLVRAPMANGRTETQM